MASAYDDVDKALTKIEERLLQNASGDEQKELERSWDRLHKLMGEISAGLVAEAAAKVSAAAKKLRSVVASAKTDPLEVYLDKLRKASKEIASFSPSGQSNQTPSTKTTASPVGPGGSTPASPAVAPGASTPLPGSGASDPAAGAGISPTSLQEAAIKAIINIFETGLVLGDYSNITLIRGDTGGLTYGRSQTTLNGGGLASLVRDYCSEPKRPFASELNSYQQRLEQRDQQLNTDIYLHNVLRAAADYEIMRVIQDRFFDRFYWNSASETAQRLGVTTALAMAVVYDGFVHGSFDLIRTRTTKAVGLPSQSGEQAWISRYVSERRNWLTTHPREDLQATVYRMDTMQALVDSDLWDLQLPLVVRGLTISQATLNALPERVYSGPPIKSRDLAVGSTVMVGQDVRHLQVRLSASDIREAVRADALFGQASMQALRRYQTSVGLPSTGIADRVTFERLGF